MKISVQRVATFVGSLSVILLLAVVAEACPNCKETLAGDPTQQGLAKGIYYSILFMMSMPFFIFGSLCAYFYYLVRRDQAEKARTACPSASAATHYATAADAQMTV